MPDGFLKRETDGAGHSHVANVFFQTHRRTAQVFLRTCSESHIACNIRWSGGNLHMHRHSNDTIVVAELCISAYEFMLDAKGPGMESFVRTKEKEYALAGSPADASGNYFMGPDTFRGVFDGYYCRTDIDANRPCHTCERVVDPVTGDKFTVVEIWQVTDRKSEYENHSCVAPRLQRETEPLLSTVGGVSDRAIVSLGVRVVLQPWWVRRASIYL